MIVFDIYILLFIFCLFAQGNVINALAEKANAKNARASKRCFIPYRNSKLTRVRFVVVDIDISLFILQ